MQFQSTHIAMLAAVLAVTAITGCSKKDSEKADNAAAASAAEAAAVPMTAAPANDKGANIAVTEDNAAVDAGPDATASTAMATDTVPASGVDAEGHEALEGAADNSEMDKISENDQVIDNEPASPNAPRATEEGTSPNNVGNARVGQ